jgi:sulfonate transport system substrate-binding protein
VAGRTRTRSVPDPLRRRLLTTFGGSLALAAAGPRLTRADAPLPQAIHIAGLASLDGSRISLSGNFYVIDQQQWLRSQLARQNIGLEWFPTAHEATGPMINEAFANGTIQLASYGDLPSVILNANGVETRLVVANGVGGQDSFLVVPASSKAATIEDLKGKTLAIHRGRPWELPLLRLLDSKHLSYEDFKTFNMNPTAGMAAIAAGRIDALFTTSDAYLLEAKGVGRIIWSTKSAPPEWWPRTELWVAKSFVDRYPDLVQLVVTAYVKASHWASLSENRETMIKQASRTERPEEVIRRTYAEDAFSWKDRWSPLIVPLIYEHYRGTVALALRNKIIARPVDVDNLIDPRFATKALQELDLTAYWQPWNPQAPTRAAG